MTTIANNYNNNMNNMNISNMNNYVNIPQIIQTQHSSNNNSNMILPPPPGLLLHPHQFNNSISINNNISNNNVNNNNKNEKINGGVSETLDYDIDLMAEFIIKTAYMIFGTDTRLIQLNTIDDSSSLAITSSNNYNLFLKGIISVLNATRLPSVTIFMSLDYLMKYLRLLPDGINSIGGKYINVIYQNTIVSLILANKFNDDKTFTNKSWSQATGMDLSLINTYERNWLNIFNWKLYDDKFILYNDFVLSFQQFNQHKKQETSIIQEDLLNDLMKSPLGVPSPYFASSTGMNTPSTPFGLQTPKLSVMTSQAHYYSSPYHYMNNNSTVNTSYQPVPNYNYQQPQPYQSNFNIPIIKSSPITNRHINNNSSYDDQFNYDYYNFYDSKQDPTIYPPQQAQAQAQIIYPIYQQKNLQNDNLVWLSTNQQTYSNYSTIY